VIWNVADTGVRLAKLRYRSDREAVTQARSRGCDPTFIDGACGAGTLLAFRLVAVARQTHLWCRIDIPPWHTMNIEINSASASPLIPHWRVAYGEDS
jgi:hypothetical protein